MSSPLPFISRKQRTPGRITCAVMLAACLVLTACDSTDDLTLEQRMQRAVEQQYSGNMNAAVIELKNALQDHPDSPDARLLLGQVLLELENGPAAEIELKKAIEVGKPEELVLPHLARSWLLQRKYDEVLEKIKLAPEDGLLAEITKRNLIGQALFGKFRLTEAGVQYDKVLELAPENMLALVKRAEIYSILKNYDKVEEYIARAEAIVPNDRYLLQLKGNHLWVTDHVEDAEKIYQQLSEEYPYIVVNQFYLAWIQVLLGKVEEADKRLQSFRKRYPNHPLVNYVSALWAMTTENYEAARLYAGKVLEVNPREPRALFISALSSYALQDYEQTYTHIVKYTDRVPNDLQARKLLAQVLIKLNKTEEASEALKSALAENIDDTQLLNLLANIELKRGRIEEARLYLEKSLEKDKDQPASQNQLGMLKVLSGDVESGIEDMQSSLEGISDAYVAQMRLARNMLSLERYDEALEICEKLHAQVPDDVNAATCLGYVKLNTGKAEESYNIFGEILEKNPGHTAAAIVMANKYFLDGNAEEAAKILEEFVKLNPGNEYGLLSLYDLEKNIGDMTKAEDYLFQAYENNPNSVNVAIEMARYHMLRNEADKALEVVKKVISLYPSHALLLEVKGLAELSLNQTVAAIMTFERLKEEVPDNLAPLAFLADAYNQAQNWEALDKTADEMLAMLPTNRKALIYKAKVMASTGDWVGADAILAEFVDETSGDYEILELRGRINMARQDYDKAILYFEAAYQENQNANLVRDLSHAYMSARQYGKAVSLMTDWLETHGEDALVQWLLADVYLLDENYEKAAQNYNELLERNPDNIALLNNLSWSQMKLGQIDEARQTISRARERAPLDPNILDTEGQILTEANEFDDAIRQLLKASDIAPQNLAIKYHLAQVYHEAGERDKAVELLREIKADGRIFDGQVQAMELLENIQK
ncbi:XrtA/PEP-CTERM system TPR-repeat protein PrsT [Emcibacter sp.]|uniref:XrtA/PEP-CTERM system TPR-repeat protein PrsT n=1 Tax=Emcibacter sp. TaxID=1979954 RepID=UPI002AA8449A|nr:XrtA/PEP-CTERM system TPR-repeat protein PrsT [Emcibacter sp.]